MNCGFRLKNLAVILPIYQTLYFKTISLKNEKTITILNEKIIRGRIQS